MEKTAFTQSYAPGACSTANSTNTEPSSPPKEMSSPSCWECLRRCLACDGSRPVCAKCVQAGLVCPGFEDQKPLTWLTPGKVSLRPQQRRPRRNVEGQEPKSRRPTNRATKSPLAQWQKSVPESHLTNAESSTFSSPVQILASERLEESINSPNTSDSSGIASSGHGHDILSYSGSTSTTNSAQLPSKVVTERDLYNLLAEQDHIQPVLSKIFRVEEDDLCDAVDYYTHRIYLPAVSQQLVPSVYFTPTAIQDLLPLFQLSSRRNAFIATTLVHQMSGVCRIQGFELNPANPRPIVHQWKLLYRHISLAVRALNDEITQQGGILDTSLLLSILLLLGVEASIASFVPAKAHADGFLDVIRLQGGLGKLIADPQTPKELLLGFVVSCTLANTTSPPNNQIGEVTNFSIDDMYNLYSYSIFPPFICPPHLFLDIIRINRVRVQHQYASVAVKPPQGAVHALSNDAESILQDIEEFRPEFWVNSSALPHPEECLLIARIFQSAVALYATAVLSAHGYTGASQPTTTNLDVRQLEESHRIRLFELLQHAIPSPCKETMIWPLVVAGASCTEPAQREAIAQHMDTMSESPNLVVSMGLARSVLGKFWESDKTGWDDCFHKPSAFL